MSRISYVNNDIVFVVKAKPESVMKVDDNFLYFKMEKPIDYIARRGIKRSDLFGKPVIFEGKIIGRVIDNRVSMDDITLGCKINKLEWPALTRMIAEGLLSAGDFNIGDIG